MTTSAAYQLDRHSPQLASPPSRLFGFMGNSQWVVFRGVDSHVYEWDPPSGRVRLSELDAIRPQRFIGLTTACYSPDGGFVLVIAGSLGPALFKRNRKSGALTDGDPLDAVNWPQTKCAFAPDGQRFAVAQPHRLLIYSVRFELLDVFESGEVPQYLQWVGASRMSYQTIRKHTASSPERYVLHTLEPLRNEAPFGNSRGLFGATSHQHAASAAGAFGVLEPNGVLFRSECAQWYRTSIDGAPLHAALPTQCAAPAANVDELASDPTGRHVAALLRVSGMPSLDVQPTP